MRRRADFDLLRVLCMLGVVYLHATASALRMPDHPYLWHISNVLSTCAAPAVPLFFMISGALLLSEREEDALKALPRRLSRVLVPLACWSGLVLWHIASTDPAAALDALGRAVGTPVNVAYWFLYALVPMYLLSPVLKSMCTHLSRRQWRYLMLLWAVLTLGLNTLRAFLPAGARGLLTPHGSLNLNVIGGYLGYFLLGAYLDRLERLPRVRTLALAAAALAAVIAAGTYWDTFSHMAYSERFKDYLSVFPALLAALVFLLAKALWEKRPERTRLLPFLASCSFGVYLVHPLVLLRIPPWWHDLTGSWVVASVAHQALYYLLVLGRSVTVAAVLASVPGLSYLFTGQRFYAACQSGNLIALFRRRKNT